MRIARNFLLRLGVSLVLLSTMVFPAHGGELLLNTPPHSIAQWYKPQNKRQVWLHTMFSLRRSMQAVEEYLERNEPSRLERWAVVLDEEYRKLGDMVPEWQDELETEWSGRLRQAAADGDVTEVRRALGKLRTTCRSCHNEFRTVTNILYRSPDFSALRITTDRDGTLTNRELMQLMSRRVNQVKIFQEDHDSEAAKTAAEELGRLLKLADTSCSQCHQEDGAGSRNFSTRSEEYQSELLNGIALRDVKQVNSSLGKIGAFVCARCHSIHRPIEEIRAMLKKRSDSAVTP